MSIIALSFASSERSTRPREGLSGAVKHPPNGSIPSWRGLIRPGGLCFFHVEFWPVAPLRGGSGSIVQIWLLRDRQFARTLLNRRQLRQLPSAIAGYSAWSIMTPLRQRLFWYPRCLEELRRRSP